MKWTRTTQRMLISFVALAVGLGPRGVAAQGQCNQNGVGSCTIGGTGTYAIYLTVTTAVRLAMSSSSIALDSPGAAEFEAGFGQTTGPTLTMRSNSPWTITIRTTQVFWSASPAPAWATKPAADLKWSTVSTGPFADITVAGATLRTAATATAGTPIPLFFRVSYGWNLDAPGTYTLPVQLVVTAP